ncbi:TIP41-like protein isoform X5 [Magnolia sinica]|uniref:TIP41-like protein isoform X5 n=1 Tax=Magnolia sinica TaxID=86752 RepID=UPI002659D942|nr:TIP41-like protein isoform X5 [Magnolia sinica]
MEKEKEKEEKEEDELKATGAEALTDGRSGLRIRGWVIESFNRPILSSSAVHLWEQNIGTSHLPEMVFGESSLLLSHADSGIKIHFSAFDALKGWKHERLPPVEVPAAAKWKFRSKPFQQVILDYDYTFTTPYCGSETIEPNSKKVVLYEDELADNGVSLLTVKVRVMPSCWFLLLRFWLRVDGVLMRLRDTRMYCAFGSDNREKPIILRESCWREATFQELSAKGFPSDSAAYGDPNLINQRLSIIMHKTQKLKVPGAMLVSWLLLLMLTIQHQFHQRSIL